MKNRREQMKSKDRIGSKYLLGLPESDSEDENIEELGQLAAGMSVEDIDHDDKEQGDEPKKKGKGRLKRPLRRLKTTFARAARGHGRNNTHKKNNKEGGSSFGGRRGSAESLPRSRSPSISRTEKDGDDDIKYDDDDDMDESMAHQGKRMSALVKLKTEVAFYATQVNEAIETNFRPSDMRCLALVAHNHMKPAMKAFIESHNEILKYFRLTGTNTTITMCKTVFGPDNPEIEYGPTCTSGPLGGDAQLAALMCLEDIGGIIFFMDPLSAHPHQCDIDSLVRLTNVANIILCPNPTTAMSFMWVLRQALEQNSKAQIPSFFQTLESPSVPEYKRQQTVALERAVRS